jgi:HEAT repeat protein
MPSPTPAQTGPAPARPVVIRGPRNINLEELQAAAVRAVKAIGTDDPAVVTAMVHLAVTPQSMFHYFVSDALTHPNLAPAVRKSVPLLRQKYAEGGFSRQLAIGVMASIVAETPELIDALMEGAHDPDPVVASAALTGLGRVRERYATVAECSLEALPKRNHGFFSLPSAIVFGPVVSGAERMPEPAREDDPFEPFPFSRVAAAALTQLTPRSEAVYEVLLRGLNHSNACVRAGAVSCLMQSGERGRPALDLIERRLLDESIVVRYHAAQAVFKLTGRAGPMIPFHILGLKHPTDTLRWSSLSFLELHGRGIPEVVPALVEILRHDQNPRVRGRAALVLGHLGRVDADAESTLQFAARNDEFLNVREAARGALQQLAGEKK